VLTSVLYPLSSPLLAQAGLLIAFSLLLITGSAFAQAPIFPDQIATYKRNSPKTVSVPDRDLLSEYGLEATESADYATPPGAAEKKRFSATAWRFGDSTGAYAMFLSRRPPGATSSDFANLAVRTSDGVIFAFGNYVFQLTGELPQPAEMQFLYGNLPKFSNAPLPTLLNTAMPSEGRVANSERYILGPVSLQRADSSVPPSTAAFRLGAEGQSVKYNTPKGILTLTLFNYPTPAMSRDQAAEFQKIPMAMVKRTGPMIAVTVAPADPDTAERLLAKINYQAQVTVNAKPPGSELRGFLGDILNMFALAGVLIGFCLVAGLAYGAYLVLRKKFSRSADPDAMIVLSINASQSSDRRSE
jgi:hypothetical protein